jgi:hypothetical protein
MNDIVEMYESLNDFARTISSRQPDEWWVKQRGENLIKNSVQYRNSVDVMLTGDPESARLINQEVRKIRVKSNGNETRTKTYNSTLGFVPNMGRVMTGHPENMINLRRQKANNTKVLNIIYNTAIDYTQTKSEIAIQGARIIGEIINLEKNGYRVNLYVSLTAKYRESANNAVLLIKVKDSGKPINITRLAFPLINDSFLRKIIAAWIETNGSTHNGGYGIPRTNKLGADLIRKTGKFAGFMYTDYYALKKDSRPVIDILKENII